MAITRVSVSRDNIQGNSGSYFPALFPGSPKIAFASRASNLVPSDANNSNDVFLKDLFSGVVTRISTSHNGVEGNGDSTDPVVSLDGKKIAFTSEASNLVAGDTNNATDIFIKDLTTGALTRVTADGIRAGDGAFDPVFSPDATKLAYLTTAYDPNPSPTGRTYSVIVEDLITGAETLIVPPADTPSRGTAFPVFSPDGSTIAFTSSFGLSSQIYAQKLATGTVTNISTNNDGSAVGAINRRPVFSPDGSKIAFSSLRYGPVTGDTNNAEDIYIKDLATGLLRRVSTGANGEEANAGSFEAVYSPDGRKIAFLSDATNLVPGDTNGATDVFIKNLDTGAISRISSAENGSQADGASFTPVFSPDGGRIAFGSLASNLVPGDTNSASDVFVVRLVEPDWPTLSVSTASPGSLAGEADAIVITEGGPVGKVRITLSAASDFPITVKASLAPLGFDEDVRLEQTEFIVPAGQAEIEFPVLAATRDSVLERIESGTLTFSASASLDLGTEKALNFPSGNSVQVRVHDEILSEAQFPEMQKGFEWASKIVQYWDDATKTSAVLHELPPKSAGGLYANSLSNVAAFAGVAMDGALVKTQLEARLTVAEELRKADPQGAAEVAYAAYEAANVTFMSGLVKTALVGSAGLFVGGVVAGLTGVAVTAALPVLVTVGIGWAGAVAYDEYVAPLVKSAFEVYFERGSSKDVFIEGYLAADQDLGPLSGLPSVTDDVIGTFDSGFYKAVNADVAAAGVDPAQHYAKFGWQEGRDPSAFFSTKGYLSVNSDVRAANVNPLVHYNTAGWQEGRDPGLFFDTHAYLAQNPDVKAAGMNPLEHYLTSGHREGRSPELAVFDAHPVNGIDQGFYFSQNPDVAASGMSALEHYALYGWREGRDPNAYFSTAAYLAANPDVAEAGMAPLAHYEEFGWREHRSTGWVFNTKAYLAANPDVIAAQVNPLDHWLGFGINEGRNSHWETMV